MLKPMMIIIYNAYICARGVEQEIEASTSVNLQDTTTRLDERSDRVVAGQSEKSEV